MISALGEPTRRALYEHVAAAGDWVSRDEAADAVDLERGTAAHHLDRLAADGLLEVDYQRLSGRQGPGAGRPAKLYRRARRDFDVTLPPRDYVLAGRLLAEAADRSRADGTDITEALHEVASAEGKRLGRRDRVARLRSTRARSRRAAAAWSSVRWKITASNRAPTTTEPSCFGTVPFHQLAQEHTDLICGMNLCMMKAAIDNVEETGLEARLEPEVGQCCVKLTRAAHA